MSKPIRILLDLDGVIANFAKEYERINGVTPKVGYSSEKTKRQYWNNFVDNKSFEKLEQLPDAWVLLDFLHSRLEDGDIAELEICTSAGGEERYNDVRPQKLKWLAANDLNHIKTHITVHGRAKALVIDKQQYRDILIDDTPAIVDNFISAGGEAILHTQAYLTTMKLDELIQ